MAAGKLLKIGEFFLAPGYSTEYMHVFLAQELTSDPLPGDQDEFLSVERSLYKLLVRFSQLRAPAPHRSGECGARFVAKHGP